MSAWYIFSALGFYPVCPGSDEYVIGSPLVKSAEIDLGNGKVLNIVAENQSAENVYVKELIIKGSKCEKPIITHQELTDGTEIQFMMKK
jgi:putative alpha-1,2-mannosidase